MSLTPPTDSLTLSKMTTILYFKYIKDYYNSHNTSGAVMKKQRTYSKYARETVLLLGRQIRLGRKKHKWSEQNLAERAGISRATLQKIEAGEMTPSIGLVFEVAALAGVVLFEQDNQSLATRIDLTQSKIALLPKRIRNRKKTVDDDF